MECPKCGYKIDENTLVCPNCKKVLKLLCPICNTVNKTNTCNSCGYTIVNKCHQCGKINPTIIGKCTKCGFDTNVSAILQGSNIDEFACVSIDFPNLKDMATILGSKKLFEKFNTKLNSLINDYVKSIGLKRQIIGSSHIIRFNKDYTYATSASNAIKSSVELLNLITQLNFKLNKIKDAQLKCNIAILKRNAYATNEDYKSGINIQLLYQNIETKKLLNSLQLITDSSIFENVSSEYPLSSIGMTRVKNQTVFLYELDLTNLINYEEIEENNDSNSDITIPEIIQSQQEILEEEDSIYDIDGIDFDEIHCTFKKSVSQGMANDITQQLMQKRKSITVLKGKREYQPRIFEIMEKIKQNNIYSQVYKVTCYDDMKYKPYGFFYDLIAGIFGYSCTGKLKELNNFAQFAITDESGFVKDMINLNAREFPHPEDVRYGLYAIFENFVSQLRNSLIIIEDAEKIDDSSFELLQTLLAKFEQYDVSYLFTGNKDFSLHKSAHFLLSKHEYTEITIKPTPIKTLIEANAGLCKNILDTFYMQKISKNTHGSQMYFMQALIHLMDIGVFEVNNGTLQLRNSKTVVFPTTLDELIQKRLLYMKNVDANLLKFFISLLLIGPTLDIKTIKLFNDPNIDTYLQYLDTKGFIYCTNETVQIQNYNLYYDNALKLMTFDEKNVIANYLVTYLFKENSAHPVLAKLYTMVESSKNEFVQWENLSNINRSLGDFSAYLNCSIKFLKLLDNNINDTTLKSIEEYKMEVYENIANLLYKYTPEKISNITQIILDNLERDLQDKKVINLCNKIMQGCLISGNYTHALLMSHKILSRLENANINPKDKTFSIMAFLISLVKIEILFNVGNLEECITLGEEVFDIILSNPLDILKPKTITDKQFNDLMSDSACYVILAKILQLKADTKDFMRKIENAFSNLQSTFRYFTELENLIHGRNVVLNESIQPNFDEKFAPTLYYILEAFTNLSDSNKFAVIIHHAKLASKNNSLNQLELFCDLMIGRSYFKLNNEKKSNAIYNSVLETSMNNGLKNITYLAWYSIAEAALRNNDINTSYGLISNAIVELDKDINTNMYILMLFKTLYAKVFRLKKEDTQANFCYNQAVQIAEKYNIKQKNS